MCKDERSYKNKQDKLMHFFSLSSDWSHFQVSIYTFISFPFCLAVLAETLALINSLRLL